MVWDLIISSTDCAVRDAWLGPWFCSDTLGHCEIRAGCQIMACFGSSPWQHITALTNVKGFITLYQYLETCSVYSNHVNACRRSHPVLALKASAQPTGKRCAHLRAELAQSAASETCKLNCAQPLWWAVCSATHLLGKNLLRFIWFIYKQVEIHL